ncbi:MAG: hypothetical protein Q8T08_25000 [Ignavibacteria bacterium]|nr:hypothetical protein [Ignavibacteria bacterium]
MEKSGNQKSNDARSNSMNPNNSANKASMDNHSNQLNPNNAKSNGTKKD